MYDRIIIDPDRVDPKIGGTIANDFLDLRGVETGQSEEIPPDQVSSRLDRPCFVAKDPDSFSSCSLKRPRIGELIAVLTCEWRQ